MLIICGGQALVFIMDMFMDGFLYDMLCLYWPLVMKGQIWRCVTFIINRNIPANSPSFYDDDFRKYRNKILKKTDDKQLLQTNIGKFRQIFSDRTRYAINDTQYKFEVTLRNNAFSSTKNLSRNPDNKEKQNSFLKKQIRWDPTNIPKAKSLFNTILPPVLSRSKEIFSRLDDKIARPIISVKKDGYINGEKVKRRVFEYNKNIALRYPCDHFPSSRYVNDYGLQNIGSFKHLLNFDNLTMTSSWTTHLRNPKKIKFLPFIIFFENITKKKFYV